MHEQGPRSIHDPIAESLYDLGSGHPARDLIQVPDLSAAEIAQITRLMRALADLRETEQAIMEASEKYMKLSRQDMRALHYLIIAKARGELVTPGMIAAFLKISAASTTKLLNRLERGGHVVRRLHPTDRRAFAIEITPETEASAKRTVGKQHAKRLHAAARLTGPERETVIRFLQDMAGEISITTADWAPN
ncbi:MarR family winged helix-turn-helix transcriptional regulator [Microbacterium sp.]|uniref:MarR family winged helix-turn-helix transcriptional regulator n=1 Tax=Microbacterium sp. TaxID=51671 RepID=UPI0039E50309